MATSKASERAAIGPDLHKVIAILRAYPVLLERWAPWKFSPVHWALSTLLVSDSVHVYWGCMESALAMYRRDYV